MAKDPPSETSLAECFMELAQGATPQGRELEAHSCQSRNAPQEFAHELTSGMIMLVFGKGMGASWRR